MAEDKSGDGVKKGRTVLGDVTNRPVKRRFSTISGDSGVHIGDGKGKKVVAVDESANLAKKVCLRDIIGEKGKNVVGGDGGSELAKKVCLGVEDIVSEKCVPHGTGRGMPSLDDSHINVISLGGDSSKVIAEMANIGERSCDSGSAHMKKSAGESDDFSKSSSVSAEIQNEDCYILGEKCQSDEARTVANVRESDPVFEGVGSQVGRDDVTGGLAGSARGLNLPIMHGSSTFQLEKCTAFKEGSADSNIGHNMLKDCSCSFCLKAAYIWSDLHYQDIKGRITALKKSQKEASSLVQSFSKMKEPKLQGVGSSSQSSTLETDLSSQWRLLFHHMEDKLSQEISQHQDTFAAIKALREECKTDLETANTTSHEKQ